MNNAGAPTIAAATSPLYMAKINTDLAPKDHAFNIFKAKSSSDPERRVVAVDIEVHRKNGDVTKGTVWASKAHADKIVAGAAELISPEGTERTEATSAFLSATLEVGKNNIGRAISEAGSALSEAINNSKVAQFVNNSAVTRATKGLVSKMNGVEKSASTALDSISWAGIKTGAKRGWTATKEAAEDISDTISRWASRKMEQHPIAAKRAGCVVKGAAAVVGGVIVAPAVGGYLLTEAAAGAVVGGNRGIKKGIENTERLIHNTLEKMGFQDSPYNRKKAEALTENLQALAAFIQGRNWKPTNAQLRELIQVNQLASTGEEVEAALQELKAILPENASEESDRAAARLTSRREAASEESDAQSLTEESLASESAPSTIEEEPATDQANASATGETGATTAQSTSNGLVDSRVSSQSGSQKKRVTFRQSLTTPPTTPPPAPPQTSKSSSIQTTV